MIRDGSRGAYRIQPAVRRFTLKYVVAETGCWEWTASRNNRGYGVFTVREVQVYAHRWSYEFYVDAIPHGWEIDHLCRNRACVNPTHLEVVTRVEHGRRSMAANATHCVNGHEMTEANTYRRRDDGTRQCKRCTSDRVSAIGRRKRAEARSTDLRAGCPGDPGAAVNRPDPIHDLIAGNQGTGEPA